MKRSRLRYWILLAALAPLLASCLVPADERVAGTSTEAGNAGGKLSLSDGRPAEGVSVSLVARSFLPDTLGVAAGDLEGAYYRARTGADGRFSLAGVRPGRYRVMAVGREGGFLAESLVVEANGDTAWVDETLKPLGAVRGVAKLVGSDAKVRLWVRPKATLKAPPAADGEGLFRLDSLPEGEYELVPQCMGCAPAPRPYHVKVEAGRDTLMADTLKLYPDLFPGYPDSGLYRVRAADLPLTLGGKPTRAELDRVRPLAAAWTWNGDSLPDINAGKPGALAGAGVVLERGMFAAGAVGILKVTLTYPDTQATRTWRVELAERADLLPLALVEAASAEPVPGPDDSPLWRVRVARSLPLAAADAAFWGLASRATPEAPPLPAWIEVFLPPSERSVVAGPAGPRPLTFLLIPDTLHGSTIFRPRRDERFEDFASIRLAAGARLGFRDSLLVPSLLPGVLVLDRTRGVRLRQRYLVGEGGAVREALGDLPGEAALAPPLLFYRKAPAGAGFDWETPARDAAACAAVTREGRAWRLDGTPRPVELAPGELASLEALLAPLAQDPPAWPDTAAVRAGDAPEYAWYRGRGLLRPSAGAGASPFPDLRAWLARNGLIDAPPPLAAGVLRYLGFRIDSSARYTGDTLLLEVSVAEGLARVIERLSPGSPAALAGDTAALSYSLLQDGDSLAALADPSVTSRLLGRIDGRVTLFALAGLRPVRAGIRDGLPVPVGDGSLLSGRLEGILEGWGKALVSPGVLLDGRGTDQGRGMGFLYAPDGTVERAWRFGGRSGAVYGWTRP